MRRPKVKLDNIFAIITLARTHDIDRAASELGLTSSAVRKQIENIESVFGIRLFESIKGTLSLTLDGEEFHTDAKRAVEQVLLAEEKVFARQAIKSHHLLVGHSTNLPPKLITSIRQISIEDSPSVRIEHKSGLTSTTIQRVIEGSLHAGFGILPIRSSELLVRTIFEEPLVACIPTGHKLVVKPAIYPHDFDGEPMIAVSREPWPERHREIEDHFSDFGIDLHIVADAYSAPEALTYVEQKIGICLLAGTSVVVRPGITVRSLSTRILMRRCGVFIREDNRSPILQKLVEIALRQRDNVRLKR
jgi:DNA-binding transcriptional LysR family regulator